MPGFQQIFHRIGVLIWQWDPFIKLMFFSKILFYQVNLLLFFSIFLTYFLLRLKLTLFFQKKKKL